MKRKASGVLVTGVVAALAASAPEVSAQAAAAPEVVQIWPGPAPGTEDWRITETEGDFPGPNGVRIHTVTNVTVPTLTVVRPAPQNANGTAVIVCPGGGFQILAIQHEGLDVAAWLAARGITAFVLKYRVRMTPAFRVPEGQRPSSLDVRVNPEKFKELARTLEPDRQIAVADGIQAVRFLRSSAARFGIRPDRIGMMGFSAGAMTTMGVVMDSKPADRPNFAAPVYGAMEDKAPPTDGPPLFVVATQDDALVPAIESTAIFNRWFAARLPAEIHIYERGGHGFGAIRLDAPVDAWKDAFEAWLKSHGWAGVVKSGG